MVIRLRDVLWTFVAVLALLFPFVVKYAAPDTSPALLLGSDSATLLYCITVVLAVLIGRKIHIVFTAIMTASRLRESWFAISPADCKIQPTEEFPSVFCAIMDRPASKLLLLTVIALADGRSRIFSPGITILAGPEAPEGAAVTNAAKAFVREAQRALPRAVAISDHHRPRSDSVRFYIRTYDRLWVIEEKAAALMNCTSENTALFAAADNLNTEIFRLARLR